MIKNYFCKLHFLIQYEKFTISSSCLFYQLQFYTCYLTRLLKIRKPKNAVSDIVTSESDESISTSLRVAYINIDSLNNQYEYIKDQTAFLEKEGVKIQGKIQYKLKQAENRQAELQEQLQGMTQQQFEEAQMEMQKMQYDLQEYENKQSQKLQSLQFESQEQIQLKLDSFLLPYKDQYDFIFSYAKGTELMHANQSFEITEEIIGKMNADYATSKVVGE